METVRKLIILAFCLVAGFFTSIWIMIDGWGLTPHNWGVIIGGALISYLISTIAVVFTENNH